MSPDDATPLPLPIGAVLLVIVLCRITASPWSFIDAPAEFRGRVSADRAVGDCGNLP